MQWKEGHEKCYSSVQTPLSTLVLSKHLKIKISITEIVTIILYGCETRSLTLSEKHRLKISENKILKRASGCEKENVKDVT
jgi:hypothetical protein